MKNDMRAKLVIILAVMLAACGGGGSSSGSVGTARAGGAGGANRPATSSGGGTSGSIDGAGGVSTGGGSANTGGSGGMIPATGGDVGAGGNAPANDDAAVVDAPGASDDGASPPTGGAPMGWYEAEAIPPNEKAERSEVHVNPASKCPTTPPKPGTNCQSGGGEVTWLTEGRMGWLQYNKVVAPADGMYDVTWWYHCGNNDNFGDKHCGGQTDPPTTAAGCRPHQIVVNGTEMTGTYHFPCFDGAFGIIRAATTALPLKAGENSIRIYPKQRDSADMDALQISPLGMGEKPLIKSNNVVGSN